VTGSANGAAKSSRDQPRPQGTRYPAKFPVEVTVPEPGVWEAIA
jgi:hypothetical protein